MKHKRNAPSGQEREEFEAYGEYSYAYLHDRQAKENPSAGSPPERPLGASAAAIEKRRQKRQKGIFIKALVLLAALCVLIVVLLVKPSGLLGKYVPEKV